MSHRNTHLKSVAIIVIIVKMKVNVRMKSNSVACRMTGINIQRIPDVGYDAKKLSP